MNTRIEDTSKKTTPCVFDDIQFSQQLGSSKDSDDVENE